MKTKLLSTITLIAFTLTSFNISLADSVYIENIKQIRNTIESLRKVDSSDYKNAMCYSKNSNSKWDIDLIKKAFTNTYNYYMWILELNKSNIEKTRSLTDQELKDYNEAKRLFDLEKSTPSNPSWTACDTLVRTLKNNVFDEAQLFKNNKVELGEEYKNATFEKNGDYVKEYFSNILQAKIAVLNTSNIKKWIKDALSYKWFVIEKLNKEGNIVWFYLFVRNETITNKNVKIDGLENEVMDINYLAKIYKKINAEMWDEAWWKSAPITKIMNWYYFYNIYKN